MANRLGVEAHTTPKIIARTHKHAQFLFGTIKKLAKKKERGERAHAGPLEVAFSLRTQINGLISTRPHGKICGPDRVARLDHNFLRWTRPILLTRPTPFDAIAAVQSSTGNF